MLGELPLGVVLAAGAPALADGAEGAALGAVTPLVEQLPVPVESFWTVT